MTSQHSLESVASALEDSWCRETAQVPGSWSAERPAAGQCWQSAFVVRHFFGGEIVVAELVPRTDPIQRHAWNKLPCGREVDLTNSQFSRAQELSVCVVPEAIIWSVVGQQAQLLLARVEERLRRGKSAA